MTSSMAERRWGRARSPAVALLALVAVAANAAATATVPGAASAGWAPAVAAQPPPWSEALELALRVVMRAHPELIARGAEFALIASESRWSSDLEVSLSEGASEDGLSGRGRAAITLRIPLTGGPQRRQRAQAWRELEVAREGVRVVFLSDVKSLLGYAQRLHNRLERRDFWLARVAYQQEAVDAQLIEPDRLWGYAEQLQSAEFDYRDAALDYQTELERTARRHGGVEWTHLRSLLVAIVNCSAGSTPSARDSTC